MEGWYLEPVVDWIVGRSGPNAATRYGDGRSETSGRRPQRPTRGSGDELIQNLSEVG